MENNPYQSPQMDFTVESPQRRDEYQSIGGWLVLVAIGIVLNPFILLFGLVTIYVPVFTNGTLQILFDKSHEAYHPLFGPLIIFEALINFGFLAWSAINIVLFFGRRKLFPRLFIAFIACNLAFLIADEVLGSFIPAVANSSDKSSIVQLFRTVIYASIWIPYFLVSKRVKGTFVR